MTMFNSFLDTVSDKIGNLNAATTTDKSSVVAMVNEVNGKIAFPTVSSGNPADIKGLNAQVSKSSNFAIITLLTSSSSSDADKTTIEWDGNNDVVRFRNYINNVKVKETTFVSSDFIDISSNVTVDSHITLTNNLTLQKIGKMVFVNLMFTTTAEIPVYTKIIDNIPYSPIVNSQGIQVFKQSSKDAFILTIARNSGTNTCYITTLDTIPTSTSVRSVLPIAVGN